MTTYANMSQRSSSLMTAALATEDESQALAWIADIATSNADWESRRVTVFGCRRNHQSVCHNTPFTCCSIIARPWDIICTIKEAPSRCI